MLIMAVEKLDFLKLFKMQLSGCLNSHFFPRKWSEFEDFGALKTPMIPVEQRESKKWCFNDAPFWREKLNWELAQVRKEWTEWQHSVAPNANVHILALAKLLCRGGPHTYINCDPIFNIFGAFESWFQQRFLLHKGKKNSSHFGSPKVAILDDPEKWPFLIPIQCLFWNVWFIKTAGVAAMRRDGK